ncbi:MAG TPA: hypothetical protein VF182_15955, partial [Candidatus Binatia bacterium]
MKKRKYLLIVPFTLFFLAGISRLIYTQRFAQEAAILKINQEYEEKTIIKQSRIPGAGNGLYAAVKINKGETIGELGGRLVSDD